MAQQFWQLIGGETGLCNIGPSDVADILMLVADHVERRGILDFDRDPDETAEWLRAEAENALKVCFPDRDDFA